MEGHLVAASTIETECHPLGDIDVFDAFLKLSDRFGRENVFLLESFSAGPTRDARASFIGFNPLLKVRVAGLTVDFDGQSALVELVRSGLHRTGFPVGDRNSVELPSRPMLWDVLRAIHVAFAGRAGKHADLAHFGFFGYLGYDIAHAIETLPRTITGDDGAFDAELGIFQGLIELDIPSRKAVLRLHQAPGLWKKITFGDVSAVLHQESSSPDDSMVPAPRAVSDTVKRSVYEDGVRRALHHIAIGDIYQVQLGHELVIDSDADPLVVYRRLRHRNPSPYMYVAPFRSFTLVGASPELYVRAEPQALSMRPIAGTARRTEDSAENERVVEQLKRDEKEIAEHIMLVDLCRNDLGRVCAPRTLAVDELLVVERYSHVYHLVSNVTARPQEGRDVYDVINATFPAGTMTGAPKIRAMEVIESIETTRRGPYAGAIGMISFDGQANLALCIRTAVRTPAGYRVRASAGVVADSTPEREWTETLHKMAALYWAITDKEIPHESIGR